MDNETPRPMRRVHRNIFDIVSKRLEKFEQNLSFTSPTLFYDSGSSINDLSAYDQHSNSESNEEQNDNISLQSSSSSTSESPQALHSHPQGNQLTRQHSSNASLDMQVHVPIIMKDSGTQIDQEMQIICKELMEDKVAKLHGCRDYDKKVSLLRIAISFNTPKITVPVILYLENTLSKAIFYELIKQHPSAIKNYINIAKLRLENDYYIAMLKQFGKNEDVAMIRIRQASEINNTNNRIALLDQAAIELQSHSWWHLQITEYQRLLQKQRELEAYLSSAQINIHLENRTVLETYKILFDLDFRRQKYSRHVDKTTVEHSKGIETAFRMSPEMILCGKLSVIMQCGLRLHYDDFIQHTTNQSFFGKKYIIPPENYADMVYKWVKFSGEGQERASEKAERFLNMISNPEKRLYYAEKFQNYNVAMDTIAYVLRDRVQLENLCKRMPQDHPAIQRATQLLENAKWRN